MMPAKGDHVFCKLLAKHEAYRATVVTFGSDRIVLKYSDTGPIEMVRGMRLMVSTEGTDYYTEVMAVEGDKVTLKCLGTEQREYFRVDTVMPVIVKKVDMAHDIFRSKIITEYATDIPNQIPYGIDAPDETISPVLWKMLIDINTKVGLILDRITLGSEGLIHTEYKRANLSASGIRLNLAQEFQQGDYLEVKMLLPSSPPIGVVVYGTASWVKAEESGEFDTAIQFVDVEENVREEIIQYTLQRQREIIRKQRGL